MTRPEKALVGIFPLPPVGWQHSITPAKPAPPDTSSLAIEDLQRLNLWLIARQDGSLHGYETVNMSPPLQAMVTLYETYFNGSDFRAWLFTDNASRSMQWRLHQVDVVESVNLKNTVPPAVDPYGIGTDAPAATEIVNSSPYETVTPEYIVTGGPSPEVVFGDDGLMVTEKQSTLALA